MKLYHVLARSVVALSLVACVGCPEEKISVIPKPIEDPYAQLGPGELALRKVTDPVRMPDFSEGYQRQAGLAEAVENSLNYMSKASSQRFFPYQVPDGQITHDHAVESLTAFLDVLQGARSGEELDRIIRQRFDVYESVGYNKRGDVLFTGYYRPIFDARLEPDGEFVWPLYSLPPDLVKGPDGQTLGRRTPDGGTVPYYTRGQIERDKVLQGHELCYLRDRFEAYIVTVQGSGKLRLPDGRFFEIGYAANSGHEYTSIGRRLVEDGRIDQSQLSLQGLIAYFKQHPEDLDQYLPMNDRYVFFTPRSGGPWGCLNEPVTAYRTVATDKSIFPRACLTYVDTELPFRSTDGTIKSGSYRGFALDQDAGGAIRAAGRCDVFLGTGPEVGELAGRTLSTGRLFYLFLKTGTASVASPAALPPLEPAPAE